MNSNKPIIFDVIVIGGGPGGLSSGLYASRQGLSTLLIEAAPLTGGQMLNTDIIDNYIGAATQEAVELSNYMLEDASKYNLQIHEDEKVISVTKSGNIFTVKTNKNEYNSLTIIVAVGSKHKKITNKELKHVSYCAVCDSPFYSDLDVAVVGGGQTAVESALLLADIAKSVTLIHRRDKLRNEHEKNSLYKKRNINYMWNTQVLDIKPINGKLQLELNNGQCVLFDGLFPCIGQNVDVSFIDNDLISITKEGKIIVNNLQKTITDGLFAIGDVTDFPHQQVTIAVSQGAIAALEAYKFINLIK